MHAIIAFNAPNFTDAGRQPFTAIHNLPNYTSKVICIDVADDVLGCLDNVQVNSAENTPVATSPVPVSTLQRVRTINRLEGLAILERKKARLAQEEFTVALVHASDLKRVRTVNKLEGLAILERRKARLAQEEFTVALVNASGLERVRTVNKLEGLAILERRKARLAQEEFTVALVNASSLKRVRTVNKLEGLAMLERRRARVAGPEDGSSLATGDAQTQGSSLQRVRTINRLEGLAILERRKAGSAQEEFTVALPMACLAPASGLKRVRTVNKLEGLAMLERRRALVAGPEDGSSLATGDAQVQGSSLQRVRTINRLEGLAILERRKARSTEEEFTVALPMACLARSTSGLARTYLNAGGRGSLTNRWFRLISPRRRRTPALKGLARAGAPE